MFFNLTPHTINVETPAIPPSGIVARVTLAIPPSGIVARVNTSATTIDCFEGIDVVQQVFGEVDGLPHPQPGMVFIVSSLVILALKARGIDRPDVVAPDTSPGGAIRDDAGRVIGTRRFVR